MAKLLEQIIPDDEREEIKEFISILILLPKEDRAVLLSNATVLKIRNDLEKADKSRKELQNQE